MCTVSAHERKQTLYIDVLQSVSAAVFATSSL